MADLTSLHREELIELIMVQQRMIEDQQRQIAELRDEIEQLRRGGKRQAAPFSKGKRVENPNRQAANPDRDLLPVASCRWRKQRKRSSRQLRNTVHIVAETWSRREKK